VIQFGVVQQAEPCHFHWDGFVLRTPARERDREREVREKRRSRGGGGSDLF
jgi:hypothetical protein